MHGPRRDRRQAVPRIIAALLLAGVGIAFADDPAKEPEPIFVAARAAVADGRIVQSKTLGRDDPRKFFSELPDVGAVLVGFDLGVGKWVNTDTVYALRPIYLTAQGEISYQDRGLFMDRRLPGNKVLKSKVIRTERVLARPGYAVGGVTLRSGLNIDGLAVTFMKIKGRALDPGDSYTSAWVGDRYGGREASINGKGGPVLGIFGSNDDVQIQSLGLYFGSPPSAVTKPPAEPPKVDPPKVEQPVDPPADPPQKAADPAKGPEPEAAEGFNWLSFAIFGAVSVPIFVLLLFLGRKDQAPVPDHEKTDRPASAGALAALPRPTANEAGRVPEAITATPPVLPAPTPPPVDPASAWAEPWLAKKPNADVMSRAIKEVALTLFSIAALQLVCGLAVVSLAPDLLAGAKVPKEAITIMAAVVVGIGIVYAGLGCWSLFQPLPAAIVGLVLYVGIFLFDLSASPEVALKGILVKAAIAYALVRAVTAAAKANSWDQDTGP